MTEDHFYRLLYQELAAVTNDGLIVVDANGVIVDINPQYCRFLGRSREEAVGRPIEEIISTTSMYEVMRTRHRGDGPNGLYLHYYLGPDVGQRVDTHAVGNRFCFFDEDGNLLGAAAQVVFKERTMSMASELLEEELKFYKAEYQGTSAPMGGFDRILGNSPKLVALKKRAMKVAKRDFPVLITGETGTGKELFAKALHMESHRKDKPIISINCAAIPSELLESELFGYEEGAFTGARRGGKLGRFQLAEGGTLFLDEIGDMPLPLQAKLLRVLQEKEIERVGGGTPIPIDVRIIAATRRNLESMIQEGTFREDLYYRLNVINLETIPLREHPEDILLYAEHTLQGLDQEYKTETMFSDAAKRRLTEYAWPGNVRELINVVTSAYASCDMMLIDEVDLPAKLVTGRNTEGTPAKPLREIVADYEAAVIRDALRRNEQNCKAAAEDLGIDRSLLYRKMQKAGIRLKKTMTEHNY